MNEQNDNSRESIAVRTSAQSHSLNNAAEPFIRIESLTKQFDGTAVVEKVDLNIYQGELFAILGGSGCGKTTLLRMLAGLSSPDAGSIHFDNHDITQWEPFQISRAGISRSFQNICLFSKLSVLDNVIVSCQVHQHTSFLSALYKTRSYKQKELELREKAWQLLSLFGLEQHANQRAASLAYGDQRRLEIARALAMSPKLLIIDEPAAGMNPSETKELLNLILKLKEQL